MNYKQQLIKIGNSVGIIIPKKIRDTLDIDAGSVIYLRTSMNNNKVVMETQPSSSDIDPQFYELVKSINKKYSEALNRLAKR